ncbi:conserved protein, unknown function [Hepatocystis sp. ex Piliocolobus tephrosceles]|nr:conserved protein, unknown function [Hepatocystis sp. ex Piliocolobus tephrosceles]
MGNKVSDTKRKKFILYKDIKNRIKTKNNFDARNNIFISETHEKKLVNLNNEIFDFYCSFQDNEEYKTENVHEQELEQKEKNTNSNIIIKFNKHINNNKQLNTTYTNLKKELLKESVVIESNNSFEHSGECKDDNKKKKKSITTTKDEKKSFELDYGIFYNIEEKIDINYKNKSLNSNVKTTISTDKNVETINENLDELKNKKQIKNTLLKKQTTQTNLKKIINNNEQCSIIKKEKDKNNNNNVNQITTPLCINGNSNSSINNKQVNTTLLKTNNLILESNQNNKREDILTCDDNNNDTLTNDNFSNTYKTLNKKKEEEEEEEETKNIYTYHKSNENNKNNHVFIKLLKKKKILQNILSFLNCSELLEFQKTCSIIYIYVSDFLDYICLNIFYKFQKTYQQYFTPFNFFYKYECLYTDKPSYRLDCILIAKIDKKCAGYNNRFGYRHKYIYDKNKNIYYIYYNFNVMKSNSTRIIEIHKDISYNNGDDINVSHIINTDACANDYICIPINIYNFIGTVDYKSIIFIPNKLNKYVIYNNQFDDQLWYSSEEYKNTMQENELVSSTSFLPYLKPMETIYSGIDVTVMKSTYKAVQPGNLGRRSYVLWGNYFIIEDKYDSIFVFLKREGLQHDYIYHNFYLRVGDLIVFYLIKGGNYDI